MVFIILRQVTLSTTEESNYYGLYLEMRFTRALYVTDTRFQAGKQVLFIEEVFFLLYLVKKSIYSYSII